ncbi:hypothetical protein [Oscillibacter sp. GMB15532]|uniref:hypothetical protein n=1 Tax=Oscillibacter sp. GMB15532 TaxID=3230022 RepID=UPI0034DFCD3E
MVGNLIGLWILYFLGMVLAVWGLGSLGFLDGAFWAILAAAGFLAFMTCIYIKLTELHAKQKDIEKKLDALLAQQPSPVPDELEPSSSDKLQD